TPYGYDLACTCNTRDQQTDGRVRSADTSPDDQPPQTPVDSPSDAEDDDDDDDDDDDEDEDEEDEDDDDDTEATKASEVESSPEEGSPPKEEGKPACTIVAELFNDPSNFKDVACNQKYGPKAPTGWKCIPSGDKTVTGGVVTATSGGSDTTGGLCIPPRRRRLYVGKLEEWVTNTVETEARGSEAPSQSDKLRTAFIQSAAIETFFLWHRYKKEKKKEIEEKRKRENGLFTNTSSEPDELDKKLKEGKIDDEFKRQMFYTLGDYRDICTGDEKVIEMLKASGIDMEKIKKAIEQSGEQPPPDKNPSQPGDKRTALWDKIAEPIWNGMVCALTYEESGEMSADGKTTLKRNDEVYNKFFGENNPANPGLASVKPGTPATSNGTYESKYQYDKVKLEDTSGAKSNDDTKLENFVLRPPYFRYLEEWGQNFCKERKKRLEKIQGDCTQGGDKQYSGDGEDCKDMLPADPTKLPDLGSSCPKSCSSYRKWIERKKDEFTKQKNAFTKQKDNYVKESINHDKEFCGKLKDDAAQFLERLKNGPCKNDNVDDSGKGKKFFENEGEAFRPATNCTPCPKFKVKCNGGVCAGDGTKVNCSRGTINANDIENKGDSTQEVTMLVSDNSTTEFKGGLEACKDKCIFEGIRKDEWKCGKVCGYVVCKPVNVNGQNDATYIIQIRALFKRWLEYFFEDYNKIKHKISHCIKNGEQSP
ncbi:hypothetical protein PFFCH_05320, partial [Plasmodium falciparum FCH/4]